MPGLLCPFIKNNSLGAKHVGAIATKPDNAGSNLSRTVADCDFSAIDINKIGFSCAHAWSPELAGTLSNSFHLPFLPVRENLSPGHSLEILRNVTDMSLYTPEILLSSSGVIFPVKDAIDFTARLTTFPR
jgi:hypothetical protein